MELQLGSLHVFYFPLLMKYFPLPFLHFSITIFSLKNARHLPGAANFKSSLAGFPCFKIPFSCLLSTFNEILSTQSILLSTLVKILSTPTPTPIIIKLLYDSCYKHKQTRRRMLILLLVQALRSGFPL